MELLFKMAFLGVGKKGLDGRQVRIEHRGRHLRASRTGGVALRKQIRAGGLSLTANTQRGARVSMTPVRNTQVAFQNSRFILRGRYGKGPAKLNLSKSGLTLSAKAGLGTINITNLGRSSAKIAGVQMRGHKAAAINAVVVLFQMLAALIRATVALIGLLVAGMRDVMVWLFEATKSLITRWRFQQDQKRRATRTRHLVKAAGRWVEASGELLDSVTPATYLTAMEHLLVRVGQRPNAVAPDRNIAGSHIDGEKDHIRSLVDSLSLIQVNDPALEKSSSVPLPATGLAVLALRYRDSVANSMLPEAFYQLDETTLEDGPRTIGQELLLEDVADLFGLRLEAREGGQSDR